MELRVLRYFLTGINDQIDAAYRAKYGRYPQYVAPMLTADVRSTTLKLAPQV